MRAFENSKFIWSSELGAVDSYTEFYANLQIAGSSAICRISVDSDYTLFINGKFVSSGQYGDFEHYKIYDEIDISPFIHTGANDFCVLCWYFGKDSSRYKKYGAGVIFEVCEGDKIALVSDERVLARESRAYKSGLKKQISSQLGFSFEYDSTKEDEWLFGKGDGFKKAVGVSKNCDFYPRPIKKHTLAEAVYATPVYSDESSTVFDLGREYVGLPFLEVICKSDTKINVAYGECLENGHVKRRIHDRDFSFDYVAKQGKSSYTNYMLRLACRYLEISTHTPLNKIKIGIIPQVYEVSEIESDFLSGSDRKIYDACVNTLRLCMMEHYVDCPWREQCLYAFDSRNQMLCGYYAFEGSNLEYARANLMLIGMDRREDGLLSICSPCGIDLTIPSFSLHYITAVKEYFEYSRDASLLVSVDGKLRKIIDTFLGNMENGLVKGFSKECYWGFYDWSPFSEGNLGMRDNGESDAALNMLTIIALCSYLRICEAMKKPFPYERELSALKDATKSAFFDTSLGLFEMTRGGGQHTELINSLGIISGLCSYEEAQKICESLSQSRLIPCSLSMKCFKYDAMLLVSKEKYKSAVLDEIRTTYEKMIPTGTVWETDEGASAFDNAGSLCHGWSAIPIYYYHRLLK